MSDRVDMPADAGTRGDPRVVFVVATLTVAFMGFGATLALLPERVAAFGHGDLWVGVSAGVFPATAIAGRLVSGRMIDRMGARTALAWGVVATSIGSVLLALPHLAGLLIARAAQGIGDGILYTAAAGVALELVPTARRGQALGWLSAGLWTGLSLGAAAGPWFPGLPAAGVAFGAITATALLLVPRLPSSTPSAGDEPGAWLERSAVRAALVIGLTNAGYASITGFAVLLANDRYGNGNWLLTTFGVTLLVVRGALGFVADRIPPRSGLNAAHAVLAVGLVTVVASPSLPVAIVGIVICAMGHSLPWPILVTTTIDRIGDHRRGAIIGTMSAGFDITVAVLLMVFGLVSSGFGPGAVFVAAVVLVALAHVVSRPISLVREPVLVTVAE
jgi:MFS family permease